MIRKIPVGMKFPVLATRMEKLTVSNSAATEAMANPGRGRVRDTAKAPSSTIALPKPPMREAVLPAAR